MSLDVDLIDENGNPVYEFNITHNLNKMASACGLYMAMWRPEEIDCECAEDLIPTLQNGIINLALNKDGYLKYEPDNGWGTYDGLLRIAVDYLAACEKYPKAKIEVSR